jgi:hypothetical protein
MSCRSAANPIRVDEGNPAETSRIRLMMSSLNKLGLPAIGDMSESSVMQAYVWYCTGKRSRTCARVGREDGCVYLLRVIDVWVSIFLPTGSHSH